MSITLTKLKSAVLPLAVLLALNLIPALSFAQGRFDIDSSGGGGGGDITDVPVDGGTWLLLGAGAAMGIYKLYKLNQMKVANA
ncbi:MAG: hypothetical protein EBX41_04260 [Chitinophagia bacterium]|nr:hypothetical protein [Chitinophagia bacterium]